MINIEVDTKMFSLELGFTPQNLGLIENIIMDLQVDLADFLPGIYGEDELDDEGWEKINDEANQLLEEWCRKRDFLLLIEEGSLVEKVRSAISLEIWDKSVWFPYIENVIREIEDEEDCERLKEEFVLVKEYLEDIGCLPQSNL